MITEEFLRHLGIDAGDWLAPLKDACESYEIDNDDRIAAFLATCLHESAGFSRLVEDLNYSPQRLLAVWPKRFTPEEAVNMAHDPVRIAERAYGGRLGNDVEGMGDGYLYRGRGLIQLTGRGQYRKASVNMGPDYEGHPDLVEHPKDAVMTAAWFWAEEKLCNGLADKCMFSSITTRINGSANPAQNGMTSRLRWLDKVRAAM